MHGYGAWDQQDPRITDDRLNVMTIDSFESGEPIATIVQWASHPETTLGFKPSPTKVSCIASEEDCDAEDRYFSGDFPSVLETRLKESRGGEVLYLNGAIGVLVATLHAPAWLVTEEHPITGDGRTVPEGATALTPNCDEKYECLSFLKTESVGNELFKAVDKLIQEAEEFDITEISISKEYFYTRMTNMGFRALFAEGGIGWQYRDNFNCDMPLSDDNCVEVEGAKIDDPLVAAFTGWQVTKGDFIKTSVVRVDFGSVGMLFMPGELPGELLIGLPDDFVTAATATYYKDPDEHAAASDYNIPGYLLALPDEEITFTVGLGTDELGYFVPLDDYRIFCSDDVVGAVAGMTCSELQGLGAIEGEKWVSGERCKAIVEGDEATLIALGAVAPVVGAVCRYGQMVGRAPGHYHETNSVGWDLVQDLWSAAERLYQD
jgi:hypothetical protein